MQNDGSLSFDTLREDVHAALKQWNQSAEAGSTLDSLALFRRAYQHEGNVRKAANSVLNEALAELEAVSETQARLLQLRFLDGLPVYATANQLNMADSTVYVRQREALDALTQHILEQEQAERRQLLDTFSHRLEPSTYTELFGVEEHLALLADVVCKPGAPWIVAVEGLGGIGKTSLADALVRRLLAAGRFANFGWITARQIHFDLGGGLKSLERPALTTDELLDAVLEQLTGDPTLLMTLDSERKLSVLRERLNEQPHLIVIDNLETLRDVEILLPMLRGLVTPSKFLLTSRQRYEEEPNLYHFIVPPLSEGNALSLVRQEGQMRNLGHIIAATDDELRPIYETVGGNPLALRLVVGQTHSHDLDEILHDLRSARGQTVGNLYNYIYHRAWEHLDETSQRVLLAMPLVPLQGDTLDFVVDVSAMERDTVRDALGALVKQNLVNCTGPLNARRYAIHSLTRTFLQEQVARWM